MSLGVEDSTLIQLEPPLHGNQGDRNESAVAISPLGPTIAISREAGARGETIARRVGKKLGWDVYTREHLEYLSSNENQRREIIEEVPGKAKPWLEKYAARLNKQNPSLFDDQPYPISVLILALAARGNLLLVGRGAGYILPKRTTLHVRIVAPLNNRIGYMAEYLRLGKTEAAEQVRKRDAMRIDFLNTYYHRQDGQQYDFDMVLNSAELGEHICSDLIAMAVTAKKREVESEHY